MSLISNIAIELTQFVNLLSLMTLGLMALGVQVFFRSHLKPEVAHQDQLFSHQMNVRERRLRNIVTSVEQQRLQQQHELNRVLAELRQLNVVRSQLEVNQRQLRAQLDLAMRKGNGQQHVIRQLLGKSQQIDQMQERLRKRDALIHFMLKQKKAERLAKDKTQQVAQSNPVRERRPAQASSASPRNSNVALFPVDYRRPSASRESVQPAGQSNPYKELSQRIQAKQLQSDQNFSRLAMPRETNLAKNKLSRQIPAAHQKPGKLMNWAKRGGGLFRPSTKRQAELIPVRVSPAAKQADKALKVASAG